ncbi:CoA pyrophosphatase [Hymenobacter aerilatus]|uniref:CoA pyrophosphatase n=1 Tax=Hymenobacter aerilatus TaxID=2932251 RepID=A0A8T9T0N2_9BACT|nr:CoA pyrophosphatase [Hymenobacter aerilatus]UOR05656.1 CoA pyrophosphatase [Hymenobacter aerilatus]
MPAPTPPLRDAAVLLPLYRDDANQLRMIVIRRTDFGVHGGQLAFPGGKRELQDATLEATALRETEEEIGLPSAQVRVLGKLPPIVTEVSGFRIWPFVGHIEPPAQWRWQPTEIAEVLSVVVDDLLLPDARVTETWQLPGWLAPMAVSFYRVGPYPLWGASYHMVRTLLPRLVAGEWEV